MHADEATRIEQKSILQSHAYFRVGVIRPCTAIHRSNTDHRLNNGGDYNANGPLKLVRCV